MSLATATAAVEEATGLNAVEFAIAVGAEVVELGAVGLVGSTDGARAVFAGAADEVDAGAVAVAGTAVAEVALGVAAAADFGSGIFNLIGATNLFPMSIDAPRLTEAPRYIDCILTAACCSSFVPLNVSAGTGSPGVDEVLEEVRGLKLIGNTTDLRATAAGAATAVKEGVGTSE